MNSIDLLSANINGNMAVTNHKKPVKPKVLNYVAGGGADMMQDITLNFGVSGEERKRLVKAVSAYKRGCQAPGWKCDKLFRIST